MFVYCCVWCVSFWEGFLGRMECWLFIVVVVWVCVCWVLWCLWMGWVMKIFSLCVLWMSVLCVGDVCWSLILEGMGVVRIYVIMFLWVWKCLWRMCGCVLMSFVWGAASSANETSIWCCICMVCRWCLRWFDVDLLLFVVMWVCWGCLSVFLMGLLGVEASTSSCLSRNASLVWK